MKPLSSEILYIIVFLDLFAIATFSFFKENNIASTTQGIITSCHAFAQFVCSPLIGRLIDTKGMKLVVSLSFIGTFIGYVLLGFSSSVFVVILGRILIGTMRHSALLAKSYFSKSLVADSKVIAFTNIGSVSSFAFLLGPSVGSYLLSMNHWYPISLTLVLIALNLIISVKFIPASGPESIHEMMCVKLKRSTYSFIMVSTFLYAPKDVGYFTSFDGFIGTFSGMFISYFGQRIHWFRSNQYLIAILLIGVVDLVTSNCSSFNLFLSLTLLNVFFSVSISPLLQNAYSNCFEPEEQGRAMGVLGSVDNLAGMCGPLVGGILFDAGTSSFSFLLYRLGFKQSAS